MIFRMTLPKAERRKNIDLPNENLDRRVIEKLKRKIVIAENTNLRTKNKSDQQMVQDIKKWIEEEVTCCSKR